MAQAAWGNAKQGGPGNPQELNRYSYALNNPVRNTDATGHCMVSEYGGTAGGYCPGEGVSWVAGGRVGVSVSPGIAVAAAATGAAGGYALASATNGGDQVGSGGDAEDVPSTTDAPTPSAPNPAAEGAKAGAKRQPTSNPMQGKPGSTSSTYDKKGDIKQERVYADDGYPDYDIDYDHDHGQGQPHRHDWDRPPQGRPTHDNRQPGRPLPQ